MLALAMRFACAHWILFLLLWACSPVNAQDSAATPAKEMTLLRPSRITLTETLQSPHRSTTLELANQHIVEQIDRKRAADAARSPLDPFWTASFWNSPLWIFIPIPMGPQRGIDDPFHTPAYMTVQGKQQDHEMKVFEKRALKIFER